MTELKEVVADIQTVIAGKTAKKPPMSLEARIAKVRKVWKASRAKHKKTVEKQLHLLFKTFFQQNPNALAVFWNQYTPYYQDGSPCEFNVNDIMSLRVSAAERRLFPLGENKKKILLTAPEIIKGAQNCDFEFEPAFRGSQLESVLKTKYPKKLEKKKEELSKCFTEYYENGESFADTLKMMEDDLKDLLGDHVVVCVGRDLVLHTATWDHE